MATVTTSNDWLNKAKSQLKQCTEKRLCDRMDKIEEVINSILPPYITRFSIDQSLKHQICHQVSDTIDQYEGTKKLKSNLENSLNDVIKKTRTWWNRTKSIKLGTLLFTVICFYVLHNFIKQQCRGYSSQQQITLFIDIFIAFMEETIKFPRTKPKSLIPHQCFLAQSEFRDICSEFVKTFGDENINCDFYIKKVGPKLKNGKKVYEYIKQKNRSANLFNDFKQCLEDIKSKIAKEFDNELMVKWNNIIYKFRPKNYQLSFRSITPVKYDNHMKHITAFHNNIPHNYRNNCDTIHSNSNYYNDQVSPSTEYEFECNEYVHYNTNAPCKSYQDTQYMPQFAPQTFSNCDIDMQKRISFKQHAQYNPQLHFEPETLCNQRECNGSLMQNQYQTRYNHREFQSTNQFCSPLNRVHRTDYIYNGNNMMRNTTIDMREQRREMHIEELMNNRFDNSYDNSQYLLNDNNIISDVSSINASNGGLSQNLNSFSLFSEHVSDNNNIVSDINGIDKDINGINFICESGNFNSCNNYNNCFFDDNSIISIPNPFENDNFVQHII